jgi:thiol-disulfide isomerase/thioredoxin
MIKRLHFKHWMVYTLLLFLGYQNAGKCAAFVFSRTLRQERQLRRPMPDSTFDFQNRRRIRDSAETALHETSLSFKNFEMMLDAFRDEPVLVYFSSNVCGNCHLQKKELVKIQNRFFGLTNTTKKKVLMIDADLFPQICLRYDVNKLPCILLINNGRVLLRLDGFTTADDILNHMQQKTNHDGFYP